jgi:hypothetical protein
MKSITIATTRFNEETYKQNINYKNNIQYKGCLYGTPLKIKEKIPLESNVYVIEMNNEKNKIEGIGLIINKNILDKNYRIYNDKDYNRYIYKGNIHLSATDIIDSYNKKVIIVLEQLLFKGEKHCKRAQGITQLPEWILNNKSKFDFIHCFNEIFKKYINK